MSDQDGKKFLSDMYDDFFWLISGTPEAYDAAKKALENKKARDSSEIFDTIKSKEEILKAEQEKNAKLLEKIEDKMNKISDIVNDENSKQSEESEAPSKEDTKKVNTDTKKEKTPRQKLLDDEIKTKLEEFFKRIDDAHLQEDSKLVLKKMIEYAKKYYQGLVKNYIPFNMRLYTDNDDTLYSIVNIIADSFNYFNYSKNDTAVERSFFVIEEPDNVTDLYNTSNSFVIFKDVNGLLNQEKSVQDKLLSIWENKIFDYSNQKGITTIISDRNKEKIDELLANHSTLRDKVFDFELYTTSATSQEVYQKILDTLKEHYEVTDEFEVKLLDYITETYSKTPLTIPEYTDALIEKIMFNLSGETIGVETIPEFEKNKSIEEIFKDLNELVGLQDVKDMLKDLVSLMQFKDKAGSDLKIKDTNLHMVFLGNPGTGKTTVARMVAGILYNLKYIKQNKLIEVSAKDLVGQYVGQTAPKTMGVIEKALGGVLFIDEAYSLATKPGSSGNNFNEECVATLIQAMENYRDNLVVIFAGYSKEMDGFLKSNSGIVSRIGYTLEFKDYTPDELIQILKSMFKKAGFLVSKDAIQKARDIIEEYRHTEGFGNARFVRNLYEKAVIKHASNTKNTTSSKALKTIVSADITSENIAKLN